MRKPSIAKYTDYKTAQANSVEYQEKLPAREGEVGVVHSHGACKERREPKVNRQSDSPIPQYPDPAGNIGSCCFESGRHLETPVGWAA
jgi:hypothetical protein